MKPKYTPIQATKLIKNSQVWLEQKDCTNCMR